MSRKSWNPGRSGRIGRRAARRARRRARRHSRIENLFFGTALAAFGIVAWGFQQEREWADQILDWWPLLLVWIGLGKFLSGRFTGGIALVTGGGLAFLHLQGLADFEYTWPLILVAVGVAITLGALVGKDGPFSDDDATAVSDPDGSDPDASDPDASGISEASDNHFEDTNHG